MPLRGRRIRTDRLCSVSFAYAVFVNLASAALGGGIVFFYERAVRNRRGRVARWWWNPLGKRSAQLFVGARDGLVADESFETFFSASDAAVIGRLTTALEEFFDTVELVHRVEDLDWDNAIVSVGGPVANILFRRLNESAVMEYRFDTDQRTLVNRDGTQRFNNTEATAKAPSVSHALVGKFIVRSDRSRTSLVVIAGTYGPGTREGARHLTDAANLKQLRLVTHGEDNALAVLRVVEDDQHLGSSLSSSAIVESVDRRLLTGDRRDD